MEEGRGRRRIPLQRRRRSGQTLQWPFLVCNLRVAVVLQLSTRAIRYGGGEGEAEDLNTAAEDSNTAAEAVRTNTAVAISCM